MALWPLASLLLTLPILAYLYHRDGRLRAASAVSAYLAVLYVLGLGCFTLYPLPDGTSGPGITYGIEPRFNPLGFLDDLAKDGVRALPDMVANVAFFVPLGFIAGRLLRWRFAMTLAAGFGTSLLIETAQLTGLFGLYPYAYRMFDVLDPVSYTHLDVYKRQMCCRARRCRWRTGGRWAWSVRRSSTR